MSRRSSSVESAVIDNVARTSTGTTAREPSRHRGITRDTSPGMGTSEVNIRELRNHGGEVVDRVAAGERLTITRSGKPVAELHPVSRPTVKAEVLLERWRRLPNVDPGGLRQDLDDLLDPSL